MRRMMALFLMLYASNVFSQTTRPASQGERTGEGIRVRVWEKDPFLPPAVQAGPEVTGGEVATDLALSAILFSEGHSSAVINGKIYHTGDDISGQKIIDIKRTYVIVGSGKKSYRLELRK